MKPKNLFESALLNGFIAAFAFSCITAVVKFFGGSLGLDYFLTLFFITISAGLICTLAVMLYKKEYAKAGILAVFPFYSFKYLLNYEDGVTKKILSILVMGAFVLFVIVWILRMIMTPMM